MLSRDCLLFEDLTNLHPGFSATILFDNFLFCVSIALWQALSMERNPMALAFTLLNWRAHRKSCVLTDSSSKSPEVEFYWIDLHHVPIPE